MMEEVWKQIIIDGEAWDYEVSDMGNIRNMKNGKILKGCLSKKGGYLRVDLCKNGKHKKMYKHRLVASMFIPNDDESKTQVNHKNEDKTDNRSCNLEWCTCEYNINYGTRTERVSKANSKTLGKKIMAISLTEKKVMVFQSMHQAEKLGFDHSNISKCCRGELKQYKGYTWKYI